MILTVPAPEIGAPIALRERCESLGLAVWRCDTTGRVLSDPNEPGPAGLWFRAGPIAKLLSRAAVRWAGEESPTIAELFPGCWAVPIVERRRRERTGYTVAVALGLEALEHEIFQASCSAAQLDSLATRKTLSARARYDLSAVDAVAKTLNWMVDDLGRLDEHDRTVRGFTTQLTDCFETIDLLYSLGRSMNDLRQPGSFVHALVDRLQSTTSFEWVAVWLRPISRLGNGLAGLLHKAGHARFTDDRLVLWVSRVLEGNGSSCKSLILPAFEGDEAAGGQILVQPVVSSGKVIGVILAGDKIGSDPQVSSYDIHLLEAAAGYLGAFLDNAMLYSDQRTLFLGTLEALTASIDAKDRYTCGHSQRVAQLAKQLAQAAGFSPDDAERVRIAGLVHDVGKIGVPETVLCKQGRLTDEEFALIKAHPEIGHRILRDIPLLSDVLPGVLHHHERWDGRGYPHGLSGDEIPFIARLLACADTFDAMSSTRSYRSAMPRERVLAEIERAAGTQLDPTLTRTFLTLDLTEYDRMAADEDAANPLRWSGQAAA